MLRSRFVFCVIISFSTNDPDLRWSLVVESADGPMVHHPAEVRGFTGSAEAGVHAVVVAAGLAQVAVRVLHSHPGDDGQMSAGLTCVHSPRVHPVYGSPTVPGGQEHRHWSPRTLASAPGPQGLGSHGLGLSTHRCWEQT